MRLGRGFPGGFLAMTSLSSTFTRLALVGLSGFLLVQACSASATSPNGRNSGGSVGTGGATSATGGSKVFNPDVLVPPVEGGMSGLNPLCGIDVTNGCLPDDDKACLGYMPGTQRLELLPLGGAGGEGGSSGGGSGGASGSAGEQGAGGDGGVAGSGGVSGAAGGGGVTGAAGSDQTGSDAGGPAYACRVVRSRGVSLSECAATGRGDENAPCFTGADCGAGLGCVADGAVSRCLPYCCEGDSRCSSAGSYCAERPLRDASIPTSAAEVLVPVCVPADHCELSEPFPCPSERACQCSAGTACMVVRPDGTTACAVPGQGTLGQACPCAYGFICSQGTGTATCVKLCATSDEGDAGLACPAGKCQASSELPAGWGVCVGG
jgi:hypothetical protein